MGRVLVDDNMRVARGDVLVQLDKEPYQVQVAISAAAVAAAERDLTAAKAQVLGQVAQASQFALLRNEGGSVGTSMAKTMVERRDQFHTSRIGEILDPLNPAVSRFSEETRNAFFQQTGDPALAQQMTWQVLGDLRHQQSVSLSYFDDFWIFAAISAGLILLIPFMKRSVAEKGAHIAAE